MKRILASFLLVFIISFCQNIKAFAYSSDPEKFISEIIDEAKLILNSQDSKETKAEKSYRIRFEVEGEVPEESET